MRRAASTIALVGWIAAFAPLAAADGFEFFYSIHDICRKHDSVDAAARRLDCIERVLDHYGSITAKSPDVWGQDRLTKFRREFEAAMAGDLNAFTTTVQGSRAITDQVLISTAVDVAFPAGTAGVTSNKPPDTGTIPPPNPVAGPAKFLPPTLEPILAVDQKATYIGHLQALRRINDGDDTADGPGYSLYLIRVPVSIIPGKKTQRGYGAEITFSAKPRLQDDLLPSTFRRLVMNDLVDQLAFPLMQVLQRFQDDGSVAHVEPILRLISLHPALADAVGQLDTGVSERQALEQMQTMLMTLKNDPAKAKKLGMPSDQLKECLSTIKEAIHQSPEHRVEKPPPGIPIPQAHVPEPADSVAGGILGGRLEDLIQLTYSASATRSRHARLPFPISQIPAVYGRGFILQAVGQALCQVVRNGSNRCEHAVKYHDVVAYLQDELQASYDLLMSPENAELWEFVTPELAKIVRRGDWDALAETRRQYCEKYARLHANEYSVTRVFAWAILVESALLTEQLCKDIRRIECMHEDNPWPGFYLPDPPPDACTLFNNYLTCRWPARVFSIDPLTEDQNVIDQQTTTRDMQLAMASAFSCGKIGAHSLSKIMQRLQSDINALAVHRTVVGFCNGPEMFGWRFYPRIQPAPKCSWLRECFNIVVCRPSPISETEFGNLEPGVRECAALLLLPAFVVSTDLEVTSRWFRLDNPAAIAPNNRTTSRLDRDIRAASSFFTDLATIEHCDQPTVERLRLRLDQVAARMPWQSVSVELPFEASLGGFEIFAAGSADLGPELFGWFGSSGLRPDGETTVFLTGHNFSLHETSVIVEGRLVPPANVKILSRRVLQVTLPAELPCMQHPCDVSVHVATPYGVSQQLEINTAACCPPSPHEISTLQVPPSPPAPKTP